MVRGARWWDVAKGVEHDAQAFVIMERAALNFGAIRMPRRYRQALADLHSVGRIPGRKSGKHEWSV